MANMAFTNYVIEGSEDSLQKICTAVTKAISSNDGRWDEYKICEYLEIPFEMGVTRLGGEIVNEPELQDGVLYFDAEERWGLQDLNELLETKFPDIKVWWEVEESGCEVYATNDKEGKYFPERFYVDLCINDSYDSEYFATEEECNRWLSEHTNGLIKNQKDVENFNSQHEDDDTNFIYIHQFEVEE